MVVAMSDHAFDPRTRYVAACDGGVARPIAVDEHFWPDVMSGKHPELDTGWLVGAYPMDRDWPNWEMHPEGEEILTVLSGAIELVVEHRGETRTVHLAAGQTFVMPRGAWHRGLVKEPTVMLGITYGRGTEHRDL
jgi:mannose-6-phosphate isomerase-like protein (cupin superfamily)